MVIVMVVVMGSVVGWYLMVVVIVMGSVVGWYLMVVVIVMGSVADQYGMMLVMVLAMESVDCYYDDVGDSDCDVVLLIVCDDGCDEDSGYDGLYWYI